MEKGNVILDFYGDGCGNCKMLDTFITQLEAEHPGVKFEKVNVDTAPEMVEKYDVSSLPSLVFLKDGEEMFKMVGLKPKVVIAKKIVEIYG